MVNSNPVRMHANSKGQRLSPMGLAQAASGRLDRQTLWSLAGASICGHADLPRERVLALTALASLFEVSDVARHHPLDGKLVITAFFEASTRTRLSFESAVLRLDGKVVSVPDGKVTGTAKGESLADIGEMFNTYGDLLVVRHPRTEALDEIRENLLIPVVNAGNGTGEHPTQALIDWYTILKWRPALALDEVPEAEKIDLCVVGTPASMRSVKSFLFMATLFARGIRSLTVASELADPLDPALVDVAKAAGLEIQTTSDLAGVLPAADLIYMNSITLIGNTYQQLDSGFSLSSSSPLKEGAVVMHPLARREELDTSLDDTQHNLYFAQAASAVYLRQALLTALLGRLDSFPPSFFEVAF